MTTEQVIRDAVEKCLAEGKRLVNRAFGSYNRLCPIGCVAHVHHINTIHTHIELGVRCGWVNDFIGGFDGHTRGWVNNPDAYDLGLKLYSEYH